MSEEKLTNVKSAVRQCIFKIFKFCLYQHKEHGILYLFQVIVKVFLDTRFPWQHMLALKGTLIFYLECFAYFEILENNGSILFSMKSCLNKFFVKF